MPALVDLVGDLKERPMETLAVALVIDFVRGVLWKK
jgi:hypothetical protein